MSTHGIIRKWKAGAELARKIQAELGSGRATRPGLEVERRLAVCRRCDQFRGDSCAEIELHPDGPTLCQFLTLQDLHCRRWSIGYEKGGARGQAPGVTEEGLARLQKQGIRRTPDEHRVARREARARRQRQLPSSEF